MWSSSWNQLRARLPACVADAVIAVGKRRQATLRSASLNSGDGNVYTIYTDVVYVEGRPAISAECIECMKHNTQCMSKPRGK